MKKACFFIASLLLAGCGANDNHPDLPAAARSYMEECRKDHLEISFVNRWQAGEWITWVDCARHGTFKGS